MVTSALAWWIRQLRGKQVHRGPTIRVRSTADGVVTVHQGGRTKLMAALDPGNLAAENPLGLKKLKPSRTRVVMPVDAASVLDWPITLPAAASENLRQVVYLQLDQVTPFAAESVVFSFDVVEGVTADHSMQVGLRVAPRRLVEVQRKALEAAGFSLPWEWASVEREGDEFVIAFTPPVVGRSLVFYGAVWAINVCLLAALVAWPFWEQQRALDALQRALIDARPRAEAAAAFRDRKDGLVEQTDALTALAPRAPSAVQLIEELAVRLPDTTWVSQLVFKDEKLTVRGISPQAPGLLRVLDNSPWLAGSELQSAQPARGRPGNEQFVITAQIVREQRTEAEK